MEKPYIAKDRKDPGQRGWEPGPYDEPVELSNHELLILNRDLLLKIAEKIGVAT